MLEESRDVTAAEKAFQDVFEAADKEAQVQKGIQKKAIEMFVGICLQNYRYHKNKREGEEDKRRRSLGLLEYVHESIVKASKQQMFGSEEQMLTQARYLGEALGAYLYVVEWLSEGVSFGPDKLAVENRILDTNKKIADALLTFGKKIKRKFIERRLISIARAHAGKMPKDRQKLIVRMAAMFA